MNEEPTDYKIGESGFDPDVPNFVGSVNYLRANGSGRYTYSPGEAS
jgi:hypothetical protein